MLVRQDLCVRVGNVRAEVGGEAVCGLVNGLKVLRDGLRGTGDDGDADGGLVPNRAALIHLRDGEVEGVTKLVLEGTNDLPAIFERLRVRDREFEGELSNGHGWSATGKVPGAVFGVTAYAFLHCSRNVRGELPGTAIVRDIEGVLG
jgi:hypothetical protein